MRNKLSTKELELIRDIDIRYIIGINSSKEKIKISCPFHNEKTPSFMIGPGNIFKCFGCGVWGTNAIDFVMAGGASFEKAVEELSTYL